MIATLRIQCVTRSHRAIQNSLPNERSERGGGPGRGPRHQSTPHLTPLPSSLRSPPSHRRGVSLLEVLIAVFVLTFGLMSIAMVIPAGRALMVEASKNDRGSACGRAILSDAQMRGWLQPEVWRQMRDTPAIRPTDWYYNSPVVYDNNDRGFIPYGEVYLIDPFFFLERYEFMSPSSPPKLTVRHFPYHQFPIHEFALWGGGPSPVRTWPQRAILRRVTPDFNSNSVPIAQQMAIADRITTWTDDLIFSLEDDNRRPRQIIKWGNGESAAYPAILPADRNNLDTDGDRVPDFARLVSSSNGKFKWAIMVTPIAPPWNPAHTWDHDGAPATPLVPMIPIDSISQFEVSVIIFYNRDTYCPDDTEIGTPTDLELIRERNAYAQLAGGGIGGGDALLFTPDADNRPPGWLNVKKNQWVMLKALDRVRQVGTGTGASPSDVMYTRPTVCKWYRVVSVDEVGSTTFPSPLDPADTSQYMPGRGRYVTLAGPDWEVVTRDTGSVGFDWSTDIAEAALVDDVVGVYTTIIDVNSL